MPFTKTFHGFIENTTDSLLILEACRSGLLPTVNRRLIERERHSIKSGTIIVFDETESGIKRWTDGFLWSPSRILGNFLVYRELENREPRKIKDDCSYLAAIETSNSNRNNTHETNVALIQQNERALVGSLTTLNTTYNFKKEGLIKKTIRILVNGNFMHIVNYYSKHDVLSRFLPTPSTSPELACLRISADLMSHLQGPQTPFSTPESAIYRKRSKSDDGSDYQRQACHIKYSNLMYSNGTSKSNSSTSSNSTNSNSSIDNGNSGSNNSSSSSSSSSGSSNSSSNSSNSNSSNHNGNTTCYDLCIRSRPSVTSDAAISVFDSYNYHYNSRYKRSKSSQQDTLSALPSPTPSPHTIPSTASPSSCCGDTAILANRFNQFYSPSTMRALNRNPINNTNPTSTFGFASPQSRATFDHY